MKWSTAIGDETIANCESVCFDRDREQFSQIRSATLLYFPPNMPMRLIATLSRFAWFASLVATGCDSEPSTTNETANSVEPKKVLVEKAQMQNWPLTLRVQGSLMADEDALIGTKTAGRIEAVNVDLGTVVKQGQPLVEFDTRELQLLVAQAEAQLKQACAAIGLSPDDDESKLELKNSPPVMLEQALVEEAQAAVDRGDQLIPSKAISRGDYDTLVAQLKTAQARYLSALNSVSEQVSLIGVRRADLDLAKQQLFDSNIIAPFDAIVSQRHVAPGEYLQAGDPVVTLVRAEKLRFTAGVPESKAEQIQVGQRIEIHSSKREQPIVSTIARVSPIVVLASRSLRIEADVKNPDLTLQAGQFAEAEIVIDSTAQTIAVPASAVSQFAGVQKVWIVADGQAQQRTVRTGRREAGRIEILEGLESGDLVVSNAAQGRVGPVIAVHAATGADLHARIPDESSPAPVYE